MPPKLPYEPTSTLVGGPEPPKNRFLEAKRAAEVARRNAKRSSPEQVRARALVARAIARGDLVPEPCSWLTDGQVCGRELTEAHHRSYEPGRELDVRWLCKEHHDRLSGAEWSRRHGSGRWRRPAQPA